MEEFEELVTIIPSDAAKKRQHHFIDTDKAFSKIDFKRKEYIMSEQKRI